MTYQKELNFLKESIKNVYDKTLSCTKMIVEQKTEFDLVTKIDLDIEKSLSELIHQEFPNDHIHGEENSNHQQIIERTWTIDPIDGTCNFAHNINLFGVQCALIDNNEVVVSVIYIPFAKDFIYAIKGQGCYVNEKRIHIEELDTIKNAIVSFGDFTHKSESLALKQNEAIKYLHPQIAKIRMFGAACLDFTFVARSKTAATVLMTKNIWDIAPGLLICQEAGSLITNLEGNKYNLGLDDGIVCSNNKELLNIIIKCLNKVI